MVEKADKLFNRDQKYKRANELYTQALIYNENLPEIYKKRAETFFLMQDYESAISDFTKVIESNSKDISKIYFMRGLSKTLLKVEDKDGACSDIKKAIELGYDISNLNRLDEYCNFKK